MWDSPSRVGFRHSVCKIQCHTFNDYALIIEVVLNSFVLNSNIGGPIIDHSINHSRIIDHCFIIRNYALFDHCFISVHNNVEILSFDVN